MDGNGRKFRVKDVTVRRVYEVECDFCDRVIGDVAMGVDTPDEAMRIRRKHIEEHKSGALD